MFMSSLILQASVFQLLAPQLRIHMVSVHGLLENKALLLFPGMVYGLPPGIPGSNPYTITGRSAACFQEVHGQKPSESLVEGLKVEKLKLSKLSYS